MSAIRPVYDYAGITLYCADIFDVLPQLLDEGISFIFADPPYGISSVQQSGALQGRGRTAAPESIGKPGRFQPAGFGRLNGQLQTASERMPSFSQKQSGAPTVPVGAGKAFGKTSGGTAGRTKMIAATIYPVVIGDESTETAEKSFCALYGAFPKARHVWWGANHYSTCLPASPSWIFWDKQNTADFADGELAWSNHGGAVRIVRHQWNGLLKGSERGEKRWHPNQKPVFLACYCFERFGKASDVILEPFMGSGPGVRAAKRMNRRCIGVELSMDYCQEVIRRLDQGGLELFGGEDEVETETEPPIESLFDAE